MHSCALRIFCDHGSGLPHAKAKWQRLSYTTSQISGSDLTPAPNPEFLFLCEDFCLQPSLNWKFLLRRTWSGQKCSHCNFQNLHPLTKRNQVSLLRIHFSHPESDWKSWDVGVGGRIGILKVALLGRAGSLYMAVLNHNSQLRTL